MWKSVIESLIYSLDHPLLSLLIAFLAGFIASRIVAADRRPGIIGYTFIGLLGFFLSRFVLSYYQLNETLNNLHELRILVDLVAAFVGCFIIAALLHFIKPS